MIDGPNVVRLSDVSQSARHWGPVEMLEHTLDALHSGESQANKAIVILLDDTDENYMYQYSNAGMRLTELAALLQTTNYEITKAIAGDDSIIQD